MARSMGFSFAQLALAVFRSRPQGIPSSAFVLPEKSQRSPQTTDALHATLKLRGPALLILSDEILEGKIVHFRADTLYGYEISFEIPDIGD